MIRTCLLTALVAAILPPPAQQMVDSKFDFQPGDVVALHSKGGSFPDQTFVIASCRDRDKTYEYSCDMRRLTPTVRDDPFWMMMNTWFNSDYNEARLLQRGRAVAGAGGVAKPVAPVAATPAGATVARPTADVDGQCTGTVADASRAGAFGANVAKWAIYDNYARRAQEPGLTSPIAVGVTFERLTLGTSEPNAVLNDPGRGAYLRNDSAPRGATLYSVSSVYRVCERYSSSIKVRRMESRHVCFRDATGVWGCGIDGYPKTTWLRN